MFWVIALGAGWVSVALGASFIDSKFPPGRIDFGALPVTGVIFLVLGLGLLITPFVVTWKWFTVRER